MRWISQPASRWISQPIVISNHANPTILKVVNNRMTILVKLALQNRDVQTKIF